MAQLLSKVCQPAAKPGAHEPPWAISIQTIIVYDTSLSQRERKVAGLQAPFDSGGHMDQQEWVKPECQAPTQTKARRLRPVGIITGSGIEKIRVSV